MHPSRSGTKVVRSGRKENGYIYRQLLEVDGFLRNPAVHVLCNKQPCCFHRGDYLSALHSTTLLLFWRRSMLNGRGQHAACIARGWLDVIRARWKPRQKHAAHPVHWLVMVK
ncbi:hypothetical protein DACRYDRAFT_24627 [Dacryopinax primogenitus]|uniref:Uncharacterized protein n=1 Tax=Dacryopinax primogenitus (strain DJM 731) TaxID=1858805 RepID=M5FXA3_DACPD|nr:uncharacterized protein DACRYDRAFT_24627 [Dacryopinax primogenitus]EJT98106.1 hypothetical protein DACRYDRAFT_24627 [Dacryopinax primogenitus]